MKAAHQWVANPRGLLGNAQLSFLLHFFQPPKFKNLLDHLDDTPNFGHDSTSEDRAHFVSLACLSRTQLTAKQSCTLKLAPNLHKPGFKPLALGTG